MNDKINLIREKCIAANPEIVEQQQFLSHIKGTIDSLRISVRPLEGHQDPESITDCWNELQDHPQVYIRPIRLADVLLAINEEMGTAASHYMSKCIFLWNLRTDDLEQQSEETINFLYELLS